MQTQKKRGTSFDNLLFEVLDYLNESNYTNKSPRYTERERCKLLFLIRFVKLSRFQKSKIQL